MYFEGLRGEEMQIDLIKAAEILSAVMLIGAALFGVFRFYLDSKHQKEEIKTIKKEQTVICYALTACLNGLHQLGANGEVTEALNKMNKHINKAAHDQED